MHRPVASPPRAAEMWSARVRNWRPAVGSHRSMNGTLPARGLPFALFLVRAAAADGEPRRVRRENRSASARRFPAATLENGLPSVHPRRSNRSSGNSDLDGCLRKGHHRGPASGTRATRSTCGNRVLRAAINSISRDLTNHFCRRISSLRTRLSVRISDQSNRTRAMVGSSVGRMIRPSVAAIPIRNRSCRSAISRSRFASSTRPRKK